MSLNKLQNELVPMLRVGMQSGTLRVQFKKVFVFFVADAGASKTALASQRAYAVPTQERRNES